MAYFSNRDFTDGHLYFIYAYNNSLYLIYGVTRETGLWSAFGGFNKDSETLGSLLIRECVEETNEAIVDAINLPWMLTTRTFSSFQPRGDCKVAYIGIVCLPETFDLILARSVFKRQQKLSTHEENQEIIDINSINIELVNSNEKKMRPVFYNSLQVLLPLFRDRLYKMYDINEND